MIYNAKTTYGDCSSLMIKSDLKPNQKKIDQIKESI